MGEGRTEREALLEARVKELEAAARASAVSVAQGGVFEGIWRAINRIVPPWLAIAALAVFLAYHGFEYYIRDGKARRCCPHRAALPARRGSSPRPKSVDASRVGCP
jgi:hypothetical protein